MCAIPTLELIRRLFKDDLSLLWRLIICTTCPLRGLESMLIRWEFGREWWPTWRHSVGISMEKLRKVAKVSELTVDRIRSGYSPSSSLCPHGNSSHSSNVRFCLERLLSCDSAGSHLGYFSLRTAYRMEVVGAGLSRDFDSSGGVGSVTKTSSGTPTCGWQIEKRSSLQHFCWQGKLF
jgi:hypothetical protein